MFLTRAQLESLIQASGGVQVTLGANETTWGHFDVMSEEGFDEFQTHGTVYRLRAPSAAFNGDLRVGAVVYVDDTEYEVRRYLRLDGPRKSDHAADSGMSEIYLAEL